MSRLLTRYSDGLIDPEFRLLVNYKGVEWVTDRYVMARTDLWKRRVTARADGFPSKTLRDKVARATLSGIPRDFPLIGGERLQHGLIHEASGRTLGFVSAGGAFTPFDNDIRPLLEACDHLKIHGHNGNRIAGFQKRPRSAAPVLVCVVMGIRFVSGEYREVTS